jgi:hypothetical protein
MSCYEDLRADFDWAHKYHNPLLGNTHSILSSGAGAWSYEMHISEYTKRALTYAEDALRAVRGLLRALASKERESWMQFWGVLVSPTASWRRFLDPLVTPAQQVGMVFTYGLCWHVVSGTVTKRTPGLPSWSWAGWVGAVKWPAYNLDGDFDLATSYDYCVLKKDGGRQVLSEELAARNFFEVDDVAVGYTYNIAFEAEIIGIELTYFKDGVDYRDYHGQHRDDPGKRTSSKYAATAVVQDGEVYNWPVLMTLDVEEGSAMYANLCQKNFVQCVVLNKVWGMVVQERGDVFERVGLARLWCQGLQAKTPSAANSHLRDHFPSVVREVVLG